MLRHVPSLCSIEPGKYRRSRPLLGAHRLSIFPWWPAASIKALSWLAAVQEGRVSSQPAHHAPVSCPRALARDEGRKPANRAGFARKPPIPEAQKAKAQVQRNKRELSSYRTAGSVALPPRQIATADCSIRSIAALWSYTCFLGNGTSGIFQPLELIYRACGPSELKKEPQSISLAFKLLLWGISSPWIVYVLRTVI